ncbi:MAG TPA: SpoIID/LytB domain-containing protein [Gaiellaceae bacterium]
MLRSSLFAALAAVLGTALSALAAAQPAAKPSLPTFVIRGHGWGHGVGMGQYGALGYARHGLGYAKILAHYYPGTALTSTTVRQVRVLLSDGVPSVTVSSQAPFRVRDADGKSYKLAAGSYAVGPTLKVRVEATAAPKALPGPIMFTPGRVPLQLSRRYRGSIQVISKGGGLQAVNIVGLEDYVRGVVSQEVSSDWPAEALKTQAVASRSYAVATRKRGATYDVFADTRSQVYGGVDAEEFTTGAAVDATKGKVLTYHGQPATTYFYASSGGKTASIQDAFPGSRPVPYLVSVPDPYDTVSPYHDWGPYVYQASTLANRLGVAGKLLDARAMRNPSSRVTSVTLTTSSGQRTISGSDLRRTLGLRSSWFSIGVLSLSPPAKALVYGIKSQLSGIARAVKGARIERLAGSTWESVTPVAPEPDGTFTASITPKVTASYRISDGKASSPAVKVSVAAFVKLDPATTPSALTGRVRPVFAGATVSIQRYEGTTWTTAATAKLDAGGRFTASIDLTPGTYRARVALGHGLVPGVSSVLRVVGG